MFWKAFAGVAFFKVCIQFLFLVDLGSLHWTKAQVISSFFGITREKDIEKNSLEVATLTKETPLLSCALSCIKEQTCLVSSFGQDGETCLLYRKKDSSNSPELDEDSRLRNPDFTHFKKLGEFDPQTRRFFADADDLKQPAKSEPSSCAEINNKTNGVYSIRLPDNRYVQVYCVMENIAGCDAGGWALAMKIDGYKSTFTYESSSWTSTQTLNYPANMASLDDKELKSPAFWELKVSNICVGMKKGNETNWLQIPINANSLRSLFARGFYIGTNLGKSSWKSLVSGSSLLEVCTSEGMNLATGKPGSVIKLRIGMIGSSMPCNAPTSFIGLGSNIITSSGNVVVGQVETKTFGYILVK